MSEGRSNDAIFGKPTRTSFNVAKPTVLQFGVVIGVPFCTLVAKPNGKLGSPIEAFASRSITRTLLAGVTPRLCICTYTRVVIVTVACVATFWKSSESRLVNSSKSMVVPGVTGNW
jgi:hypothetical protein